MIELGTVLRCHQTPGHIWIVLSDPAQHAGRFLFVNLTTLRPSTVDDACLLGPQDYSLLTHQTTVAYSRAVVGTVAELERAIRGGSFSLLQPLSRATLDRIVEGARASRELSSIKKKLLP